MFSGEGELVLREGIFVFEIALEHGGIVRVKSDHEAGVKIFFYRMVGERGAAACPNVGRDADFDGDLALGEDAHQLAVADGGEAMANSLGSNIDGSPDAFGADGFSGVRGESESVVAGLGVEFAEGFGSGATLVPTDADADDGVVLAAHLGGFAEDAGGLLGAEVADGIEDPVAGNTEVALGLDASPLHAFEERLELDALPVINHSDGHVDFRVDDALLSQLLEHAVGDELVVFRGAKPFGDGFEGHEKAGEVRVVIDVLGFCERERRAVVTGAEVDEGLRLDRAFEVQVQLGFGQAADVFALGFWILQSFNPYYSERCEETTSSSATLRQFVLCAKRDCLDGQFYRICTRPSVEPGEMLEVCGARQWSM